MIENWKTAAIIVLFVCLGVVGYMYLKKSTPIIFKYDGSLKDSIAVLEHRISVLELQKDSIQIVLDTIYLTKTHVQKIYLPFYTQINTADMHVLDSIVRASFRFGSVLLETRIKNNNP